MEGQVAEQPTAEWAFEKIRALRNQIRQLTDSPQPVCSTSVEDISTDLEFLIKSVSHLVSDQRK